MAYMSLLRMTASLLYLGSSNEKKHVSEHTTLTTQLPTRRNRALAKHYVRLTGNTPSSLERDDMISNF